VPELRTIARTLWRWLACLAGCIWLMVCGDHAAYAAVHIDHHMHVQAPNIRAFLPGYCSSPLRRSPCAPDFLDPPTLQALIADMDAAGVQRGLLLSTGYLAESPMVSLPGPQAARLLREANDFTVALARARPHRFLAFVGLNPLTPTAREEIARWHGDPYVSGIKLHLTNSGVDLRDPTHVAAVAEIFRLSADAGLAIVIHMRTRAADYGAQDARIFIERILPLGAGVPVQIAHAAGWGGTDANTFAALEAFAEAIEQNPPWRDALYFDLAAVYDDQTPAADLIHLAALVRRIGPDRFVAGSDWPFATDLADYYERRYPLLTLTQREWEIILRNTFVGLPP